MCQNNWNSPRNLTFAEGSAKQNNWNSQKKKSTFAVGSAEGGAEIFLDFLDRFAIARFLWKKSVSKKSKFVKNNWNSQRNRTFAEGSAKLVKKIEIRNKKKQSQKQLKFVKTKNRNSPKTIEICKTKSKFAKNNWNLQQQKKSTFAVGSAEGGAEVFLDFLDRFAITRFLWTRLDTFNNVINLLYCIIFGAKYDLKRPHDDFGYDFRVLEKILVINLFLLIFYNFQDIHKCRSLLGLLGPLDIFKNEINAEIWNDLRRDKCRSLLGLLGPLDIFKNEINAEIWNDLRRDKCRKSSWTAWSAGHPQAKLFHKVFSLFYIFFWFFYKC